MGEDIFVPVIKSAKITKSPRRIGKKTYYQYSMTIPKEFGAKADAAGIREVVITTDDLLVGIPPETLLEMDEEQILEEFRTLVSWLKRHTKAGGRGAEQ
jgi:hypothetical protein